VPIDLDGPTPLYLQIADDLQRRIAAGEISRRLPGVRAIAGEYDVAKATASRAVRELTARGAVVTVSGRGTFVSRPDGPHT
jgi:GntR family transcriptional regulator